MTHQDSFVFHNHAFKTLLKRILVLLESDVKTVFPFSCERKPVVCLHLSLLTKKGRKFFLKTKRDCAKPRHIFCKRKKEKVGVACIILRRNAWKVHELFQRSLVSPHQSHDHGENVLIYTFCNLSFSWKDDIMINPYLTQEQQESPKVRTWESSVPWLCQHPEYHLEA